MTAKTDPKPAPRRAGIRPPLPDNLADVALVDGATCAAVGDMGVSWWHDEVRAGRAPAPVIRQPRCTRWRLADVRAYWAERAAQPQVQASELLARAKKANAAAQVKRRAKTVEAAR